MEHTSKNFPLRYDCLRQVLAYVSDAGATAGLGQEQCKRMELVIEELYTNTLKYGFTASMAAEQSIRIDAYATSSGVELVYEDAGREFDPTAPMGMSVEERVSRRVVGGMGIALIGTLPSKVIYERKGGVNRITMRFDR